MKTLLGPRTLTIFLPLIFGTLLMAQTGVKDKVILKSGRIIIGTIVERIPDKAVIVRTKSGDEIIDNTDIQRVDKYRPRITSITPYRGSTGTEMKILGADLGMKGQSSAVRFGETYATVAGWSENEISVTVPSIAGGKYEITVIGDDYTITAPMSYELIDLAGAVDQKRGVRQRQTPAVQQQEPMDETGEGDISRFLIRFAYALPLKEFKETTGPDAGFAKGGFSAGWEGRAALSENFYIPFDMDIALLGFNKDEFGNQLGATVTSKFGSHLVSWLTTGVGLAIPLSSSTYLFGAGHYGVALTVLPDIQIEYLGINVTQESASAFKTGWGYSFGFTFDAVTIGYKTFFTRPKYTVHYTSSSSSSISIPDQEVEQPTAVGVIYLGIHVN